MVTTRSSLRQTVGSRNVPQPANKGKNSKPARVRRRGLQTEEIHDSSRSLPATASEISHVTAAPNTVMGDTGHQELVDLKKHSSTVVESCTEELGDKQLSFDERDLTEPCILHESLGENVTESSRIHGNYNSIGYESSMRTMIGFGIDRAGTQRSPSKESVRMELSFEKNEDPFEQRNNFGWLIQTGEVITIDPMDTIPLVCVREISVSGVLKLEQAFTRSENSPGMSKGISSAAPLPIVVKIPSDRLCIVVEYFVFKKGLTEENAKAISVSKIWYGIVEGAHRRKALINLGENLPKRFKGYAWVVLCIHWQPLEILRALARERNECQRGEHFVHFTMYDVFKNLKISADAVALHEGIVDGRPKNRGYLKRVADHYCGAPNSAKFLTHQLAGIAVSLSWRVIEEIGAILNKEDLQLARSLHPSSIEDGYDCLDARVYRNLITRSTFRGATTFKNSATENDQISALRRLLYLAPQKSFKPLNKHDVETQTRKAIASRHEIEKMEKKLQGHKWPEDMANIRDTLLTRTTLDGHLEEKKNNEDILPVFRELWEKFFPIAAEMETANRISSIKDNLETTPGDTDHHERSLDQGVEDVGGIESSIHINSGLKELAEDKSAVETTAPEKEKHVSGANEDCQHGLNEDDIGTGNAVIKSNASESDDAQKEIQETQYFSLTELSVRVENKNWREFQLHLVPEELFDFIVADPQQSLTASELKQDVWTEFKDEKKIKEFANFCRVSLRPGCYCFCFVVAEEFSAWVSAFQQQGMKVMKSPFVIIPKASSARVIRLKDLPQPCGELAVVARTPGTFRGFEVNFNGSYGYIECSFTRKFGIIDNVPRCSNPLRALNSRTEIRPRERHPDLIAEIIETFCPPTGTVLDVFGGAMTTEISCVSSRRPCTVLEKDGYCFELAVRRLEKRCRDFLLNPDEHARSTTETRDSS